MTWGGRGGSFSIVYTVGIAGPNKSCFYCCMVHFSWIPFTLLDLLLQSKLIATNKKMSLFRPEILKHEMKVFFVKYNDPIYVKLEKLDIMIRLASQANIAQVTHPQL